MAVKDPLDLTDRKILNIIQSRFPLAEEPYKAIGDEVGVTEEEVIERISRTKKRNVVRQISAIFDTRRLGYKTALIAISFDEEKLHKGALRINKHPGVSHNYAREGSYYNLWFTLAVPPHESLEGTVERMAQETRAKEYRVMPTIRFFKIGVNFDMVTEEGAAYQYYSPDGYQSEDPEAWRRPVPITDFEIEAIRELQEDLHLVSRPYNSMAARLGLTLEELFKLCQSFIERGVMRRFSAVLYHRKAGFRYNAMSVWRVPEERAEEVGAILAESPWVTHCYQRPTFPNWPYTHFGMIHATSKEKCEEVILDLAEKTGIQDYTLLYSSREYKKTRVKYFV